MNRLRPALGMAMAASLTLVIAACVLVAPPREVDARQTNSSVDLTVGQELIVRLDANPTTGYRWVVENGATNILTQPEELNYAPRSVSAPMVGSGGVTTGRFWASAPGKGTLELGYRRPWESGVPAAQKFRIDVVVVAK